MTITVHGPNNLSVDFPDGTDAQTIDKVMRQAAGGSPQAPPVDAGGQGIFRSIDAGVRGAADAATFGMADEFAAGMDAMTSGGGRSPVTGRVVEPTRPGSILDRYHAALAEQRARDAADAEKHGAARLTGQLAGGIATAGGLAKAGITTAGMAAGRGLAPRIGLGAAEGAAYGGVYGAGSADGDIGDRAIGAAGGAAVGGLTGGAIPVFTAGVRAVGAPFVNAVKARTNPAGYAAQKVAERLTSDGRTIDQAAGKIARAAQNGDNLSLADVGGENVKGLARTAVNVPGPARERITANARLQAMGQAGRIQGALGQAMDAPEGTYHAAKATVMDARSSAAKPYYDYAYKQPTPYTFDLESILQTPAGKTALATAKTNSLNRREPWAQWFASVDDAGNIIDKRRVPDTRALDETQRVLGQMVEAAKKPADGSPFAKAIDTPQSIALRTVHKDLLREMDAANPAFAKARSVGLDNIQADEALEFGRNALNTDSRVIARRMGDPTSYGRDIVFNDGQRELARIGLAEAVRAKLDGTGFTQNALLKFFSTREQVARIRPFFKSDADWKSFQTSMFNEARKRATYNAVTGNSTTARQLLDAQEAGQLANNVADVADIGSKVASGRPLSAIVTTLQSGLRRLGGLTPEVADHIGRLLMTRDPRSVQNILLKVRSIEAQQITADQKAVAIRQLLTNFAAGSEGREVGSQPNARLAPQYTPQTALPGPIQ